MGRFMLAGLLIILAVSFIAVSVFASDTGVGTPMKKLGRGISNMATCPLEVTKGIQEANVEGGFFSAITYGVLKGLVNTGVRAGVGVYEVLSFPFAGKNEYGPILDDPEFFMEPR